MKLKVLFLFILPMLLMQSCKNEVVSENELDTIPEITLIYSYNGLGDLGLNDNVYNSLRYLQVAPEEGYEFDFIAYTYTPEDMNEAESICREWFSAVPENGRRRLLVLSDPSYIELIRKHPEWRNSAGGDVLLIDSYGEGTDVYSLAVSIYGICHMAGQIVGQWNRMVPAWGLTDSRFGSGKAAVVCANSVDEVINDGCRGFLDGLESAGGTDADVYYLYGKSGEGFVSQDSIYSLSYKLDRMNYGFVMPLCGGSQTGMLTYTRQHYSDGTFRMCGTEYDMGDYSKSVAFSLERWSYLGIVNFIRDWFNEDIEVQHRVCGLEMDYCGIVFADTVLECLNELGIDVDGCYADALAAEKAFLNNK